MQTRRPRVWKASGGGNYELHGTRNGRPPVARENRDIKPEFLRHRPDDFERLLKIRQCGELNRHGFAPVAELEGGVDADADGSVSWVSISRASPLKTPGFYACLTSDAVDLGEGFSGEATERRIFAGIPSPHTKAESADAADDVRDQFTTMHGLHAAPFAAQGIEFTTTTDQAPKSLLPAQLWKG